MDDNKKETSEMEDAADEAEEKTEEEAVETILLLYNFDLKNI